MKKKKGFTLIELLSVIIIIGIVVAVAVPGIGLVIKNSRKKALDNEAALIQHSAINKLALDRKFDFSIITRDNLHEHLETNGTKFDSIGIQNSKGYITVTITKGDYTVTETNDPDILNPKIYGLKIDFSNGTYTRLDDSVDLCQGVDPCAQPGTDSLTPVNKFDEADIYKDIKDKVVDGNYFVEIPKFYIKKINTSNTLELRISKKKHDNDYYLPNVFKNHDNGTELNYVLIGKYMAGLNGGRLVSQTGLPPRTNAVISTMRNEAKANGVGYQLIDIHAIDLIQTLFHIEFATLDSQSIMAGYTNGTLIINSGTTDTVLSNSGSITSNTTGKFAMKYRGLENIYGNVFQYIDGINLENKRLYVSENPNSYESDVFGGEYKKLGYENNSGSGFTLRMGYDPKYPFATLPVSVGNFGNSVYQDYCSQSYGNTISVIMFGGNAFSGPSAGINSWDMTNPSDYGDPTYGTRILKRAG